MQAVEINATLPNESDKVKKPKKVDTPTEKGAFLDMITKLVRGKASDEPVIDADSEQNSLNDVEAIELTEIESNILGVEDFDAKLKSKKTTEGKKSLDVANVLKVRSAEIDSKIEKDSRALDFEKEVELTVTTDEEVDVKSILEGVEKNAKESEDSVLLFGAKDLAKQEGDVKKIKDNTVFDGSQNIVDELKFADMKLKGNSKRNDGESDKKEQDDLFNPAKKKSDTKPLFTVEDLRSGQVVSEHSNVGVHTSGVEERTSTDNSSIDFTITVPKVSEKTDGVFFNGTDSKTSGSSQASQSFSELLSRELSGLNEDFVRAGKVILRDNNSGSIRLNLQPEKLGNVKIFLELSGEKKVAGKIVVASEEAYEAFKENLDGLINSFEAGGFESAGFDLAWAGSGQNTDFARQGQSFGKPANYEDSVSELMVQAAFTDNNTYDFGQAETIDVLA